MKIQKYAKSIGFRIVALALTLSLPFANISAYAVETPLPARLSAHIAVPSRLGTVDKKQPAEVNADRLVIHIQDAHGQLSAQRNIDALLDYLTRRYGFQTVFLEGGLEGIISPHLLRFFQDEDLNEKIASRLLEKGEIGGPEIFLLKSKGKVKAYGVEKSDLYKNNLTSFRKVYSGKKISQAFLLKLEAKVNLIASHVFGPTLQKFLKEGLLYQNDRTDMLSHLNVLKRYAQEFLRLDLTDPRHQEQYPQLVRYFKLREMEREIQTALKTNKLEKEKDELLRWVQDKKINPDLALRMKAVLTERSETTDSGDLRIFIEHFYEEVRTSNFTFDNYPNVCLYLGSRILRQELEALNLFEEANTVTRAVLTALAKTEKEKMLVELIKDMQLLTKLFSLELSRSEWREVSLRSSAVTPSAFQNRLFAIAEKKIETRFRFPLTLGAVFQEALRFYEWAEARDLSISESLIQTLAEQKIQKAILITGGFHTEGIRALLESRNVGLLEITPKMETLQPKTDYLRQMLYKAPSVSMVKPISLADMPLPVIKTEMGNGVYTLHRNALIEIIGAETRGKNNLNPGPGLREQGLTLEEAILAGFGVNGGTVESEMPAEERSPAREPKESTRKEWFGKIKYRSVYFVLLNLLAIPLTIALPVLLLEWPFGSLAPNTKSQLIISAAAMPIVGWLQFFVGRYMPRVFPSLVRGRDSLEKLARKSLPTFYFVVPTLKAIPHYLFLWLPALFFVALHTTETFIPVWTWVRYALVTFSITTLLSLDYWLEGRFPSLRVAKKTWANGLYRIIEKIPALLHFSSWQFYYVPLFFLTFPWSVDVTDGKIRVHGLKPTSTAKETLAETLRGIPSAAELDDLFFYPWAPLSLMPEIGGYYDYLPGQTGVGRIIFSRTSAVERGIVDVSGIPHEAAHRKYFLPSFSAHPLRWEKAYKRYREDTHGFHLRGYSLKDELEGFAVWFESFYSSAGYELLSRLDRADQTQQEMWLVLGQAFLENLDGKPHLKINFPETETHWLIPVKLDENGWLTLDELRSALNAAREKQLSNLSKEIPLPLDLNTLERTLRSENDQKKLRLYLSLAKLATPESLSDGSLIQADEAELTEMLRTFILERPDSSTAKSVALWLLGRIQNELATKTLEKVLTEHTKISIGPGQWINQPVNFTALSVVETLEPDRAEKILTPAIEKLRGEISDWQTGAAMIRLLAARNYKSPEDKSIVERILALHKDQPLFQTEAGHLARQYLREINSKEETERRNNSGFGISNQPAESEIDLHPEETPIGYLSVRASQEVINSIAVSVAGRIWKESPPPEFFAQPTDRSLLSQMGLPNYSSSPSQMVQEPAHISIGFVDMPDAKDPRIEVIVELLARYQLAQVRIEIPDHADRLSLEKDIRAAVLDLRTSLGISSKNVAMHVVNTRTDIFKFVSNRYVKTLVYDSRRDVLTRLGRNNHILRVENNVKAGAFGTPLDLEALALLNAIDQLFTHAEFSVGIHKALDLLKFTENMDIRMRAEVLFKQAA